jgi:diguanylate cyclase (GGDEF)-like protein/PAS domain S-box-containing protein
VYQYFFVNSKNSRVVVKKDHTIIDISNEALKTLGYDSKDEILGQNLSMIIRDPSSGFFEVKGIDRVFCSGMEWNVIKADGTSVDVWIKFLRKMDEDHDIYCLEWESKAEREKLRKSLVYQEALFRSVLQSSSDLISYKDYINTKGMYFGANRAFEEFVAKNESNIIGLTDVDLFGDDIGAKMYKRDVNVLTTGEDEFSEEWVTYPDGRKVLLHTQRTPLVDETGKNIGLLTVSRDMTREHKFKIELERSEQRYRDLANTDDLTGVPNRRLFFELANGHFQTAQRQDLPLSLMMLDIDNFKKINDTYGHLVGDDALKHLVKVIEQRLRNSDILARYAGDEFVILLYDTDMQGAKKIAEDIRSLVEKTPFVSDELEHKLTVSIGIVMHSGENECESLLRHADEALYLAKRRGRNAVATLQ